MRRFIRRLLNVFRRTDADRELDREVASHLALLEEEHRRRGYDARRSPPGGPARDGQRRAGEGHPSRRAIVRVARGSGSRPPPRAADTAARSGFYRHRRVHLGLGIGVNTTFFTIVNAICLRGLPIESPERVMYMSTRDVKERPGNLSYLKFDELRTRRTAFEQVGVYTTTVAVVADTRQPPARVSAAYVSAGSFELLGDRPALGRGFRADEIWLGMLPVVILGGELWRSRYASDPSIVGQSITVNSVVSTVIGVMPRGFMFPANADLWKSMANLPAAIRESRAERRLAVFARLAPNATADQARADASAIGTAWSREFPATNRDVRMHVVPINERLNPSVAQRAWIAFITAGALVLLVACANVANLLLMRAATRGREMAIRTLMGATRGRVVRQLLVESGALSALAGVFGVFVAGRPPCIRRECPTGDVAVLDGLHRRWARTWLSRSACAWSASLRAGCHRPCMSPRSICETRSPKADRRPLWLAPLVDGSPHCLQLNSR